MEGRGKCHRMIRDTHVRPFVFIVMINISECAAGQEGGKTVNYCKQIITLHSHGCPNDILPTLLCAVGEAAWNNDPCKRIAVVFVFGAFGVFFFSFLSRHSAFPAESNCSLGAVTQSRGKMFCMRATSHANTPSGLKPSAFKATLRCGYVHKQSSTSGLFSSMCAHRTDRAPPQLRLVELCNQSCCKGVL